MSPEVIVFDDTLQVMEIREFSGEEVLDYGKFQDSGTTVHSPILDIGYSTDTGKAYDHRLTVRDCDQFEKRHDQ